jgi:hypothetical protein
MPTLKRVCETTPTESHGILLYDRKPFSFQVAAFPESEDEIVLLSHKTTFILTSIYSLGCIATEDSSDSKYGKKHNHCYFISYILACRTVACGITTLRRQPARQQWHQDNIPIFNLVLEGTQQFESDRDMPRQHLPRHSIAVSIQISRSHVQRKRLC